MEAVKIMDERLADEAQAGRGSAAPGRRPVPAAVWVGAIMFEIVATAGAWEIASAAYAIGNPTGGTPWFMTPGALVGVAAVTAVISAVAAFVGVTVARMVGRS